MTTETRCHGCGKLDECIRKDDADCCPDCAPYWDEWCVQYQEGLIEWCEFRDFIKAKKDGNN